MLSTKDFTIGFEDAQIAVRHLLSITSEQIDFNDVLEYIFKNFGVHRYTESKDAYMTGVQKAFEQGTNIGPGMTSESPAIQEGNIESGANSYNA